MDAASPAADAGFEAGDGILGVNGQPVRDILDWQWLTADDECTVAYVGKDGDVGEVLLEREPFEPWGITFEGILFDGTRTCKNACTFCFMRQLPQGLRRALFVRDDDFRLSFLQGNFVTLTNLTEEDVQRIREQRISPLRVSLHAVDEGVRRSLMGKHAQAGIDNLEALLAGGIDVDAQIVLVPGVNDGSVLEETLAWAYERPNIKALGVVPLGYTKHQSVFHESFNDAKAALAVLDTLRPFQDRALAERGHAWVFGADEFYLNAYGSQVLTALPPASFYGEFPMFEDGIGIVRSCVDDFEAMEGSGALKEVAALLEGASVHPVMLCGQAMEPYFPQLLEQSSLAGKLGALFVDNDLFGGNVNVTGLLAGKDMARAIASHGRADGLYLLPAVAFNADGLTVDSLTAEQIALESGAQCAVVPSNPLDCIDQLKRIIKER